MTPAELQILEDELSKIVGMYLNATNIFVQKLANWWGAVKAGTTPAPDVVDSEACVIDPAVDSAPVTSTAQPKELADES